MILSLPTFLVPLAGCDEDPLCIGWQVPGLWVYFDGPVPEGATVTISTDVDFAAVPGVIECGVTDDCNDGIFFPHFRPPDVFVTITTDTGVITDLQSPTYEIGAECGEPEYIGEVTISVS